MFVKCFCRWEIGIKLLALLPLSIYSLLKTKHDVINNSSHLKKSLVCQTTFIKHCYSYSFSFVSCWCILQQRINTNKTNKLGIIVYNAKSIILMRNTQLMTNETFKIIFLKWIVTVISPIYRVQNCWYHVFNYNTNIMKTKLCTSYICWTSTVKTNPCYNRWLVE